MPPSLLLLFSSPVLFCSFLPPLLFTISSIISPAL